MSEESVLVEERQDAPVVPDAQGQTDVVEPAGNAVLVETFGGVVGTVPMMKEGETRFGVTCTDGPIGSSHWLADSSVCGDLVMALPASVLVLGRTKSAGSIAVDMKIFLDAIVESAAKLCGLDGISEASAMPRWAVARLFGTFPVLRQVYDDAMDQAVMAVEAAAYKAAIGMQAQHVRRVRKSKTDPDGGEAVEETVETLDKTLAPDPALSKLILTSRMRGRYKDEGAGTQAVQINVIGPEANL